MAPPKYDQGDRIVTAQLPGPILRQGSGPTVVARQKLAGSVQEDPVETSIIGGGPGALIPVKLTVKQAAIDDVLRILMSKDYLDRSYVLDPTLQQAGKTITLDIDQEMTLTDIDDLLNGLAVLHGWTIQERAGITYIRPTSTIPQNPTTPIMETQAAFGAELPVIRIKRMRYLSASDASAAIKDLQTPGGKLVQSGRNVLIIDTASQANRLSNLLTALDAPAFAGVEIWTYRLESRSPEAAASLLQSIVQPLGTGASTANASAPESAVAFVPIPDSSRLIVIARDPSMQSFVRDLINQIDQPEDKIARARYIYRIQHFKPDELKTLLESFFADRMENGGAGSVGGTAAVGQVRAANGIRFSLDAKEGILLMYCTPDDYAQVIGTLAMIDRPRQQVALTSIVAEVVLTNNLEYGVEYFLRAFDVDGLGILELAGGASELVSGVPTGSAIFTAADGFAVVQALERESDVNILSQPNVTVSDGEKALMQVGGEVPVTSGNIDTTTGGLRQDIDYKKTGINLEITAQINESGDVTLKIKEEIADVVAQSELGPEFTTRMIETQVTVPHGKTILLGGIIQNDRTDNQRKIPVLGNLPIAGEAFKSRHLTQERRELLLAITPRVFNSPNEAPEVMSDFLIAAQGVRDSLRDRQESLNQGVLYVPAPNPNGPVSTTTEPEGAQGTQGSTDSPGTPVGAVDHHGPALDVFSIDAPGIGAAPCFYGVTLALSL